MIRLERLEFSSGFLVLMALFLLLEEGAVAAAILSACLVHELAHVAPVLAQGGRVRRLRCTLGGAALRTESRRGFSYGGELLAVLLGPGANLLLAVVCAGLGERWYLFSGVNLALGAFNLLPLPGLDGWRAAGLLRALLVDEEKSGKKKEKRLANRKCLW